MKKKGFTLVELLLVVTLIAAISVTVGVSMTGMLNRQDEKQYNEYIDTLEKAACTYAEINNIIDNNVSTGDLISSGLIRKDLTNPKTNKKVTEESGYIKVEIDDNELKCKYVENNSPE